MGIIVSMSEQVLNQAVKELLAGDEPPELGPGPRNGILPPEEVEAAVETALAGRRLPRTSLELAHALVLLWHDHLDASHTISQRIESADGGFIHAIMHRREPDFWNSKYWWRRVGAHPAFPEIANRVEPLLTRSRRREEADKLLPAGNWDPCAFVDACESGKETGLLREIQRVESEVLLEHFLRSGS